MKKQRVGWRIGIVVAALAFGWLVGWGGTDQAAAAQKISLSKLVDLDQIPVGVGDGPVMWTHVIYIKRIDGQRMTQALNELHATMAERGWLFLEMTPNVEDGDLKGIWVSYRATGWGPAPE